MRGDFSGAIDKLTVQFNPADYSGDQSVVTKFKAPISYLDAVCDDLVNGEKGPAGDTTPWRKLDGFVRFRPGEVTAWLGFSGSGKSIVISNVFLDLCLQGRVCVIASFEMTPRATLLRMVRQAYGPGMPTRRFVQQFFEFLTGRLWLFDVQGAVTPETVMAACRFAKSMYEADHICIDSLMKVVKKEDDYNGQKEFVDALCAYAMKNDPHIHLVLHSRKLVDENTIPGKFDAKGSGSMTDQVDNVASVWRNKKKEAARQDGQPVDNAIPDVLVTWGKQRHYAWEGQVKLWFDWKTGQYLETEAMHPLTYRQEIENWSGASATPDDAGNESS